MSTFEANGARFLAAQDMIVSWIRRTKREFEPETTHFIFDTLAERGGVYLDVGASTGWFAIPAALRGHDVIALEPNVRVYFRLKENGDLNGVPWDRLRIMPMAASAEAGRAVFYHNPDVPLTSGGSIERPTCSRPLREEVDTVPLDSLTTQPVGLIKIDVEGHELGVLAGASRIINSDRPHLVLEANDVEHKAALAEWLEQNRYSWRGADERNMLCTPLPN